jgi:carbamate kinase
MGPKIDAAARFVEAAAAGPDHARESLAEALEGRTGTLIKP